VWNRERFEKGEAPLRFGMGIGSGEIIFGVVGDKDRLEFTTIGDAVNLSAKLEKHTKKVDAVAVTTADTLREAVAQGYAAKVPMTTLVDQTVGGVTNPISLVSVDIFPDGVAKNESRKAA
jgi:adenylate cyclase